MDNKLITGGVKIDAASRVANSCKGKDICDATLADPDGVLEVFNIPNVCSIGDASSAAYGDGTLGYLDIRQKMPVFEDVAGRLVIQQNIILDTFDGGILTLKKGKLCVLH